MKVRAVFFDLDETLIDSTLCHNQSVKRIFRAHGLDFVEILRQTAAKDFTGTRMVEVVQRMRDSIGVSEAELPLKLLDTERQKIFLDLIKAQAKLLPGASEALRFAKLRIGAVAIVSSGTREYIEYCIQHFGWGSWVDFFVAGEETPHGKPQPDCYLEALRRLPRSLEAQAADCMVVEDAVNGVKAAQAAGMPVIWVPLEKQKKIDLPVSYKLNSLLELPLLLSTD